MKIPEGATYSYQPRRAITYYCRLVNNRVQYFSGEGSWEFTEWHGGVKAFLSNKRVKKLSIEPRVFKYDHS